MLKTVLKFWEASITRFKADMLLFPLENELLLPSLNSYINKGETLGDIKVASLAYIQFCNFLQELFADRYSSDPTFTLKKKMAYEGKLCCNREKTSKSIKKLVKRQKMQTAENVAEKMKDPSQLTYNPDRLKEVITYLVKNKQCHLNDLPYTE